MLNALNALSAEPGLAKSDQPIRVAAEDLLERGPAFDFAMSARGDVKGDDWPTYRHDNARTGTTRNEVPAALTKRWEARLGTHASTTIIAANMVFAAVWRPRRLCPQCRGRQARVAFFRRRARRFAADVLRGPIAVRFARWVGLLPPRR